MTKVSIVRICVVLAALGVGGCETSGGSLEPMCRDSLKAESERSAELCRCQVMDGLFPDQAACIAAVPGPEVDADCLCPLYDEYRDEAKATLDCAEQVQAIYQACVASAQCDEIEDCHSELIQAGPLCKEMSVAFAADAEACYEMP